MVDIIGSKSIYNKGKIDKVIIDSTTVTISFFEGYEDFNTGEFISVGSDHILVSEVDYKNFLGTIVGSELNLSLIEPYLTYLTINRQKVLEVVEDVVEEVVN